MRAALANHRWLAGVVTRALCATLLFVSGACAVAGQPKPARAASVVVFWCPMHPDIRGSSGQRCPICNMPLVPVSAADHDVYGLDVEVVPRTLAAGQSGRVRLAVRHPVTGETVRGFTLMHERIFHLFVVSYDLEYFAHVHPTLQPDGALETEVRLPHPGAYQLIADFLPTGASPQLVQRSLVTAGYSGSLIHRGSLPADTAEKIVSGSRVKLTMPEAVAGREELVTFDLEDAATALPVRDLEPYLGASGHLLIVSGDLALAQHSHPVAELSTSSGPTVVFQVLFPAPGDYRMWVQFQRAGEVGTASFTVPVRSRR